MKKWWFTLPPSVHFVTVSSTSHKFEHLLKGKFGGAGEAGGGIGGGADGDGKDALVPVTVKARRWDKCSDEHARAQVTSPLSSPGQSTTCWLLRSARSIVRALTRRREIADIEPNSAWCTCAAPPCVASPSRGGGITRYSSVKVSGGGGGNSKLLRAAFDGEHAQKGRSADLQRMLLYLPNSSSNSGNNARYCPPSLAPNEHPCTTASNR